MPALSPRADVLVDASTYAVAIAVIGALNAAGGAWRPRAGRPCTAPAKSR